ncbi:hypothetical protein GCM10010358_39400 [Streptomyces minutiscleroticus]|uniref:Uncharacterized protein n=1 Tax=Streptomyces minutiscleroticus TaxID=68238 RepID=A0A918U2A0_9ACTN|nr:hypothetical protein GCM10010358_39400 [Streptomyces minutiscleroticus]
MHPGPSSRRIAVKRPGRPLTGHHGIKSPLTSDKPPWSAEFCVFCTLDAVNHVFCISQSSAAGLH